MSNRALGLSRPVIACTAVALLLWPSPATASSVEVTDPAGDATPIMSPCQLVGPAPCIDPAGSMASLDIIQTDLSTDGSDLVWTTTVVDYDAPPSLEPAAVRKFTMRAMTDDFEIIVSGNTAETTATFWVFARDFASGGMGTGGTIEVDAAANTFAIGVPLTLLNNAATTACSGCAGIGVGTLLYSHIAQTNLEVANSSAAPFGDWATGDAVYRIGDA